MKIMHIAQMIQGGLASYLHEILPYQRQHLGRGNVLVAIPRDEVGFVGIDDPELFRPMETTTGRKVVSLVRFMLSSIRLIRAEKPDIVHLHSTFAGALIRLWFLLAPGRRPKVVYCAHGWAFNMQVSEPARRSYAFLERLFAQVSDAIVCISNFEYDQAIKRGLPRHLLHRIPNGIHDKQTLRGHSPHVLESSTDLNLLFVGRQDRQKGFDTLIEAMHMLQSRPITLHVVGDTVVSETSDEAPDPPNVVRHGWKPRNEVEPFLADADALVMPSRWEGFGLAAVEAMRQELPVCASNVDALPELVREGVSGYLFPAEDAAALAKLLGGLDRDTLRRMGPRAREWYLDNFTAEKMNHSLLGLYRNLLAPGRQPTRAYRADPVVGG